MAKRTNLDNFFHDMELKHRDIAEIERGVIEI